MIHENCRGGENCCEVMDEKSLLIVATASIARTSTVAERVEGLFGRALLVYCIIKTAQATRTASSRPLNRRAVYARFTEGFDTLDLIAAKLHLLRVVAASAAT